MATAKIPSGKFLAKGGMGAKSSGGAKPAGNVSLKSKDAGFLKMSGTKDQRVGSVRAKNSIKSK